MHCPNCGYLFQKLSVTTTAGGKFDVEHCGRCGATWFDPYEINRIPYHEVVRLARLSQAPRNPVSLLDRKDCPRCRKPLNKFTSESVPKGVTLLRCDKCHGIFATQKALEDFKKNQEGTIKEYKEGTRAFPALSVVFVPALTLLFLVISTLITISHLSNRTQERTKAAGLITDIHIVPTSDTTVSVTFQTKNDLRSGISYGLTRSEFIYKPISNFQTGVHAILLSDLKPGSVYFYTITLTDPDGKSYTTDELTFMTGGIRSK